jgi:hypothetical protein
MKKIPVLIFVCLLILVACNKKIHPSAITETPPAPLAPMALIVIDGYGKILTPQGRLPAEANIKANYPKMARSFTPNQITNLKYRYQTVPPKVLYVPEVYAIKSLRGTYCIYKKKFWYWKKEDGLFYLDETYYK